MLLPGNTIDIYCMTHQQEDVWPHGYSFFFFFVAKSIPGHLRCVYPEKYVSCFGGKCMNANIHTYPYTYVYPYI